MSDLRVFLFGFPRLEQGGSPVTIGERKAIALLAYLAVSGANHSRDALATMLWPEQSQSRARASLRHALWSLRKAGLGGNIVMENEKIGIHSLYWLDVIEFNHLLDEHRNHSVYPDGRCPSCQTALTEAVGLYQDDLLSGFTLRDAPQFDEWQYYQREHCQQMLAVAMERLAQLHSQQREWALAIKYARRWVALDPLHEPAQRCLMRAYAGSGNRSMALKQYAIFRKTLDIELGIAPEEETSDLAKALRADDTSQKMRPQRNPDIAQFAGSEPIHSTVPFLEREPFIERLAKLMAIGRAGQGKMVFLGAEAGGGKTTLIQHFCAGIQKSVRLSLGICDPLSTPQPLGPLWDIVDNMGGDLARLLRDGERPERIFHTFLEELRRQQTFNLVIFEDVHWSDEATLDLLRFIGRRIVSTHTLVIASYREDEIDGRHPLRILLGDLATAAGIERLHLPPLSMRAVTLLVAGSGLNPDEVYRKTGGNPFFITEMLASGMDCIPDHVRDAVLARARRLSPSARSVLDSGAVIGPQIETHLLVKMSEATVATIEECISAGVLLARGDGMEFRHELARQAILEAISPPRLHLLHRQALGALRASVQDNGNLARLAHHAEGAGDAQAVLEYAPAAARQAAAAEAHRQAAAQYERALRFASRLPDDERGQLLQDYAKECSLCDWTGAALKASEEAGLIWKKSGNRLKQGDNLRGRAGCLYNIGRYAEANRTAYKAIEILSELPVSSELARAYNQYAVMLLHNGDFDAAISTAKKAIDLGERFENTQPRIRGHEIIGISQIYLGEVVGRTQLEYSISLAKEAHDHTGVASGYCNLGRWTGLMFGWDVANPYIAEGLAHCAEFEMDFYRYFLLAEQASAYLYQGQWSKAEETAQWILSQQNMSFDTRFWAMVDLGRVRALRGDPESSDTLNQALALAEKFGTLLFLAPVAAARAEAAWLAGELDRIQAEVRSVYEMAVVKHHVWSTGELGFWLWRAGDFVHLPTWIMPVFAMQVRGDWAAAAAEWQCRGQPYERAWALAEGDVEARLNALEIFNQLGAAPAAAALRRQLRSQGIVSGS